MTEYEITKVIAHPPYYNRGMYEVADYIADYNLDFFRGNVIKYVCRAGFKDDELVDLNKAMWYLDKAIKNEAAFVSWRPDQTSPKIGSFEFAKDQKLDRLRSDVIFCVSINDLSCAKKSLQRVIANCRAKNQSDKNGIMETGMSYAKTEEGHDGSSN